MSDRRRGVTGTIFDRNLDSFLRRRSYFFWFQLLLGFTLYPLLSPYYWPIPPPPPLLTYNGGQLHQTFDWKQSPGTGEAGCWSVCMLQFTHILWSLGWSNWMAVSVSSWPKSWFYSTPTKKRVSLLVKVCEMRMVYFPVPSQFYSGEVDERGAQVNILL